MSSGQSYFGAHPEPDVRTPGDDVVIRVRVRRANLPNLERGIELGIDDMTHRPIELRLVPQADGVHALEVVTNPFPMMATPEPVDVERKE
jgi:hypothetical protein